MARQTYVLVLVLFALVMLVAHIKAEAPKAETATPKTETAAEAPADHDKIGTMDDDDDVAGAPDDDVAEGPVGGPVPPGAMPSGESSDSYAINQKVSAIGAATAAIAAGIFYF